MASRAVAAVEGDAAFDQRNHVVMYSVLTLVHNILSIHSSGLNPYKLDIFLQVLLILYVWLCPLQNRQNRQFRRQEVVANPQPLPHIRPLHQALQQAPVNNVEQNNSVEDDLPFANPQHFNEPPGQVAPLRFEFRSEPQLVWPEDDIVPVPPSPGIELGEELNPLNVGLCRFETVAVADEWNNVGELVT